MANKKFNPASAMLAFEALCKDMLINNMVQMLQTAEVEDDIIDSVLNLKSLSSKEVMEAVSIVQQVAVSTMVARNLEKAKQQEDEQRRQAEKVEGLFNLGKHYS